MFKEAAEAYDVLRDANKRRQYDQFGHEGLGGATGFGGAGMNVDDIFSMFGDIFGDLFGGGGRSRRSNNGPMQGANVRASVRITFEEAVFGCEKELELTLKDTCSSCNGSGAKKGTSPETCPKCGGAAKRETDTMPQWAGSSWYFLRYVDSKNTEELVSKEKAHELLPVDMYIGGVEHAVLHLLYSRFYTKFLYDIGVVDFEEPFTKLFNQGMITGKNGIKMSKSKGNVVSPDDLVRDYGCDALRMYELFVGPPELDAEWDDRGIDGVYRFLNRFWNLVMDNKDKNTAETKESVKLRHKMIFEISQRFQNFSLNTVVSGFMEYNNKMIEMAKKEGGIDKATLEAAVAMLAPFAPHISEELWEALGHDTSVFAQGWPEYDAEKMKDDEVEIAVQINGKTKAVLSIPADMSKEDAIAAGKELIASKIEGTIVKEIYVPKRIVNIVVK